MAETVQYRFYNESQGSIEWQDLTVFGKPIKDMDQAIAIVRATYLNTGVTYYIELKQEDELGVSTWDNL